MTTLPLAAKWADKKNKVCVDCGEYKPLSDFNFVPAVGCLYPKGYCKSCETERRKANYQKNKEEPNYLAIIRARKYAVSIDQVADQFDAQEGKCLVCNVDLDETFVIDHDHNCCPGAQSCGDCNRGLLHKRCNLLLGIVKDDPLTLRRAAEYIEKKGSWKRFS